MRQLVVKVTVNKFKVNENNSLIDVLRTMDSNKVKYVVVTDDQDTVVGTLTDGDIRRGLINGLNINDKITDIVNRSFSYVRDDDDFDKVITIFYDRKIDFIPVLDADDKLTNIITRRIVNALLLMNEPITVKFDYDKIDAINIDHEIVLKPWGYYKSMVLNDLFQSKVIYILPKQSISLQSHEKRDEYWTIISGKGCAIIGDSVVTVNPGDTLSIPKRTKHRLANASSTDTLVFTEIQLGDYFGEDDIQRYDDEYGRL